MANAVHGLRRRCLKLDQTIAALQVLRAATRDYAVAIHGAQNATADLDETLAGEMGENSDFMQEIIDQRERIAGERAHAKRQRLVSSTGTANREPSCTSSDAS